MTHVFTRSAAGSSGNASAFSASTTVPPSDNVPRISITEGSKQTEVAANTPASSSSFSSLRIDRLIAATLRCSTATPFGRPVEPEV